MKRALRIVLFTFVLLLVACARRGRPEGGPRDFDKPIMVRSEPEFESLNFDDDEIKIYFDEYIKLQNVTSQLIVSPPLKYAPQISPQGTPSKRMTIKLLDTLLEQTTYTFNFGQSIVDNTEGNVLDNFKYVLSTGDYIDSLLVKGRIKDAFDLQMIENPTIMLYPWTEEFNDSIVFQEKPTYVGSTLDSLNWNITNIKAGTYRLIALNDRSKNYKFNPKEDRIAFFDQNLTLPGDSIVNLRLFLEELPFALVSRPKEVSKGYLIFGYEGRPEEVEITLLNKGDQALKSVWSFDKEKDTIHYYFTGFEKDSMQFQVKSGNYLDTVKVTLREEEIDSMKLGFSNRNIIHPRDSLFLNSNVPIQRIDTSLMYLLDQDSVRVPFSFTLQENQQQAHIDFKREFDQRYYLNLLPGAVEDLFGIVNDSTDVSVRTGKLADYCSVFLTLNNIDRYPVVIDLINDRGEIVAKKYATEPREFEFLNLQPSRFKIRLIYDDNGNGRWDTGNYLLKVQPEEVYYFKNIIDAKANWEVVESFTLTP